MGMRYLSTYKSQSVSVSGRSVVVVVHVLVGDDDHPPFDCIDR